MEKRNIIKEAIKQGWTKEAIRKTRVGKRTSLHGNLYEVYIPKQANGKGGINLEVQAGSASEAKIRAWEEILGLPNTKIEAFLALVGKK